MEGKDQQPWRTLDELAGSAAHEESLHREFAEMASEWPDGPSRRNFLKLMGASVPLAPASATDAPISFKKFLRDGPSGHSDAISANSRCRLSSCAAEPASSSSVRQGCWSFPSMELSMADRAISQLLRVNVVRINQFRTFDLLLLTFGPFPADVKNLIPRPQILVRLAMTIQTPFHL